MVLEAPEGPPFRTVNSKLLARSGDWGVRRDRVQWPDGNSWDQTVVEGPEAVVIVPVFDGGQTLLVRQWRHAWNSNSWEAPAGTMVEGESPRGCAERELAEEAGLRASSWTELGILRGTASATFRSNAFLAQGLERVERKPEPSERDMIIRELPLREALSEALTGGIVHAPSIAAICRAAYALGLIRR